MFTFQASENASENENYSGNRVTMRTLQEVTNIAWDGNKIVETWLAENEKASKVRILQTEYIPVKKMKLHFWLTILLYSCQKIITV